MSYERQRARNFYKQVRALSFKSFAARAWAVALLASLLFYGCAGGVNTNSPANSNAGAQANANTNTSANTNTASAAAGEQLTLREPQSYSVEMTISVEAAGSNQQIKTVPIQFDFTRNANDRRWAFKALPGIGDVVYLEKSGLKYVLFPAQKRYAELQDSELGVSLGTTLTPTTAIEQVRSQGKLENLGAEPVNERAATKYRFAAAANTQTQAGTAQTESLIYIDQETGLPLRSDMHLATTGGQNVRVMTETRNINLAPDLTALDVPAGMKKVTAQELNQQVQSLITLLQLAAQVLGKQGTAPPQ